MAKSPSARPNMENRARMVEIDTRPEEHPFDPADLEATVVPTQPPPFAVEGSFEEALPPENAPTEPAANADPAPQGQAPSQTEAAQAPAPETDDIDDPRFKGKSKKELYESFRNLERLKGEHDAEVSAYRRLYEEKILKPEMEARGKPQVAQTPTAAPEDDSTLLNEMLTAPTQFAKKIRDQAKQELFNDLNRAATVAAVNAEKSKAQEIIDKPEFRTWLVQNVPQHLAQQADNDPATLQFILNSYKQAHGQPEGAGTQEAVAATVAPPPANPLPPNVDRRIPLGSAVGVPSASRATAAPTFTLAQLADMQLNRPDEYARRQPEIMAWYSGQQQRSRS